MGPLTKMDQNGGMMGPEQNLMNNNMDQGQFNGPSLQDPPFNGDHGHNGFLPNGVEPFGLSGDRHQ